MNHFFKAMLTTSLFIGLYSCSETQNLTSASSVDDRLSSYTCTATDLVVEDGHTAYQIENGEILELSDTLSVDEKLFELKAFGAENAYYNDELDSNLRIYPGKTETYWTYSDDSHYTSRNGTRTFRYYHHSTWENTVVHFRWYKKSKKGGYKYQTGKYYVGSRSKLAMADPRNLDIPGVRNQTFEYSVKLKSREHFKTTLSHGETFGTNISSNISETWYGKLYYTLKCK